MYFTVPVSKIHTCGIIYSPLWRMYGGKKFSWILENLSGKDVVVIFRGKTDLPTARMRISGKMLLALYRSTRHCLWTIVAGGWAKGLVPATTAIHKHTYRFPFVRVADRTNPIFGRPGSGLRHFALFYVRSTGCPRQRSVPTGKRIGEDLETLERIRRIGLRLLGLRWRIFAAR